MFLMVCMMLIGRCLLYNIWNMSSTSIRLKKYFDSLYSMTFSVTRLCINITSTQDLTTLVHFSSDRVVNLLIMLVKSFAVRLKAVFNKFMPLQILASPLSHFFNMDIIMEFLQVSQVFCIVTLVFGSNLPSLVLRIGFFYLVVLIFGFVIMFGLLRLPIDRFLFRLLLLVCGYIDDCSSVP